MTTQYRDPSYGKAGMVLSSQFVDADNNAKQTGPVYWSKHYPTDGSGWDGETYDLKVSIGSHPPESFPEEVQSCIQLDTDRDPNWGCLDYIVVHDVPLPKVPRYKRLKAVAVKWTGTKFRVAVMLAKVITPEQRNHMRKEVKR